jgi:hypothetical protein
MSSQKHGNFTCPKEWPECKFCHCNSPICKTEGEYPPDGYTKVKVVAWDGEDEWEWDVCRACYEYYNENHTRFCTHWAPCGYCDGDRSCWRLASVRIYSEDYGAEYMCELCAEQWGDNRLYCQTCDAYVTWWAHQEDQPEHEHPLKEIQTKDV